MDLLLLALLLIVGGFLVIFLSVIIWALKRAGEGKVEAGGVLMIGPVPIIFGTSKKAATTAALIALLLTAIMLLLALFK